MLDKVAVLLVVLSAVRASVVINVYDDDVKTLQSSGCDLRWCDQQCRRMGFPGGACVGNRCKCDSRDGEVAEMRSCDLRWCEQQCRRMGFPGGACVGDRCKCDIMDGDKYNLHIIETPVKTVCNELACQLRCQRMGYKDGTCIGMQCECIMLDSKEADTKDITDNEIPRDEASSAVKESQAPIEKQPTDSSSSSSVQKKCHQLHCCAACIRRGKKCGFCTPFHTCMCFGPLSDAFSDV